MSEEPEEKSVDVIEVISHVAEVWDSDGVAIADTDLCSAVGITIEYVEQMVKDGLVERMSGNQRLSVTDRGRSAMAASREYDYTREERPIVDIKEFGGRWFVAADDIVKYFASPRGEKLYRYALLMQHESGADESGFMGRLAHHGVADACDVGRIAGSASVEPAAAPSRIITDLRTPPRN